MNQLKMSRIKVDRCNNLNEKHKHYWDEKTQTYGICSFQREHEALNEDWAIRCETCGFEIKNILYTISSAEVDYHTFYKGNHRVYNYDMKKPRQWSDIYPKDHPRTLATKGGFEPA